MRRVLAGVALLAALATPALAQQPEERAGYTQISDEQFANLPASLPSGEKFSIPYLKFGRLYLDRYVKVHGSRLDDEALVVADTELRQKLGANRDSEDQRLVPHRSNVQVFGTGRRTPEGEYVLEVDRVIRLEPDTARFARLAGELAEDDGRGRRRLAHRIRTEVYPVQADPAERSELAELVRKLEAEARELERQRLEPLPGGAEEWLRFGRRYRDLKALAAVWRHDGAPEGAREEAAQALREKLEARLYLGEWVPFAEYKEALGFVRVDGRWQRRERVEFELAVEAERKRQRQGGVISELPQGLLLQAMNNGEIVGGMTKDHVIGSERQTKSGQAVSSLPVYVDRIREEVQGAALVWEQWIMEDGLRIYFYSGLVFAKERPEAGPGERGGE